MNLLSQRIKEAKRELTALKTAHRRGLGLLKVYKEEYTIPPPGSSSYYWLTIELSFSISNYPFVQLYYIVDTIEESYTTTQTEFEYKDEGASVDFRFAWRGDRECKVAIYSTSPITSMTYDWSLT